MFAKTASMTTLVTTIVWVGITFVTKPEADDVLVAFYRRVRPHVGGWRPIAARAPEIPETRDLARNLWCWILGCVMTYCALFGVGKVLLHHGALGSVLLIVAVLAAWQMSRELNRGMEAKHGAEGGS